MPDPQHEASRDWTWTKTPDRNQSIFTIFVKTALLTLANRPTTEVPAFGAQPYVFPTRFNELAPEFLTPNMNSMGVDTWLFIGMDEGNPITAMHFFPDKTKQEANTPYEINEVQGNHFWDAVLLDAWAEADYTVPQSYITIDDSGHQQMIIAPTVHIHTLVLPSVKEGSTIIKRKFLTALRPTYKQRPVPQPGIVDIQVNGDRFTLECLHDDIDFPATPSGQFQTSSGGLENVGGSLSPQHFKATNFIGRRAYTLINEPTLTEQGLWLREETELRPPKLDNAAET